MRTQALELADIFRTHGPAYLEAFGASLSSDQKKALRDICICRTATLGGYIEQCDQCGHCKISYCSCRNRNCPKCQGAARAAWLEQRASELLPVDYFHLVFTVPQSIAPLALQNPQVVYGILFRAASETLLQIAADPKHLGAHTGFLAVLHTWGQNLHAHPHLHCVVPGGGIAPSHSRWVSSGKKFFLPVKVLSRLFRAKFLALVKKAFFQGKLRFHGKLEPLGEERNFIALLNQTARTEWVVYAKPPFGGPQQVLKYLARYTHRVAISNQRLISLQQGLVTFRWKDYARGNQPRTTTLEATEFIRRFLLHVLPRGFVKIRHFGFLSNRCRQENIRLSRQLLAERGETMVAISKSLGNSPSGEQETRPADRCRTCQTGRMVRVESFPPQAALMAWPRFRIPLSAPDTS